MSNMSDLQEIIIQQPEESGLGSFTIGDLGVFIGTLGGVITSILIVLQKSHCKKIKLCCMECERNDPTIADIEVPKPVNKPVAQANEERARLQEQQPSSQPEPEPEPEPQPSS